MPVKYQRCNLYRYEVNPKYVAEFEAAGMRFVGRDTEGQRMEIMELAGHPYYVAVQYHPEYISRPLSPSPPYLGLILARLVWVMWIQWNIFSQFYGSVC